MLANLHIENIAVIKDLDIDFNNGFTVFTGETGAGKSIIINSISLLCGEKIQKDIIRSGQDTATISALFQNVSNDVKKICSEYSIPFNDDEIYIVRTLNTDGKSTIKINGKTSPLYALKEITAKLVTLHGQHSSYKLLESENYLGYLDSFSECEKEYEAYKASYSEYKKERLNYKSLSRVSKDKNERVELLKLRVKELETLKLKSGEDSELEERRLKIKNIEQLTKHIKLISKTLYKSASSLSAVELIDKACESLESLSEITADVTFSEDAQKLKSIRYEIEDIAVKARGQISGIDEDPKEALDKINERLNQIATLKRKYNCDVDGLISIKESSLEELRQLDSSDILIKESKEKLKILSENCKQKATELTEKREKGALVLQKSICDELNDLDMGKLSFKIMVSEKDEYDETGKDAVDFLISTNAGEEEKAVNKIASGGELSRIMLAMRSVFRQKNNIETIIYDEIDTGISGSTCEKIGRKLKGSSENSQIICITHSVQISALADNHYRIYKETTDGRTETKINLLSNEERINELSRIMGGVKITENVQAAAREMIENGTKNGTVTGI